MAQLLPFHGLLPSVERVAAVAAVPYDVVSSREAAELAKDNPWSFLHVSRPEIDLEPGIDLHDERVYAQAAAAFQRLCREVPLTLDKGEHLYVYRLVMNGRAQTGVLGAASAEEYRSGIIKKHEKTRQDKEDDRTRHVMELRSHTGPAFFTYRDREEIDALIDRETAKKPLFDFTAPDGIQHTLWRLDEKASRELSKLFADLVPVFYIADGHHRSAAAARTAAECAPKNPNHTGKEDYNYFLTVAFPATQLRILPYNRVVRSLNGNSPAGFLTLVGEKLPVPGSSSSTWRMSGTWPGRNSTSLRSASLSVLMSAFCRTMFLRRFSASRIRAPAGRSTSSAESAASVNWRNWSIPAGMRSLFQCIPLRWNS